MPSTTRKDCPKTQEITSGLRFGERKQETTPSKPGQRAARVQVQAPWLSYAVHSCPTLSLQHGAQDGASRHSPTHRDTEPSVAFLNTMPSL